MHLTRVSQSGDTSTSILGDARNCWAFRARMTRRRNCRRLQSTSHFRAVVGTVEYPHRLKSETLRGTPAHRAPTINLRFRRGNQRGMDRAADHWPLPFGGALRALAEGREKGLPNGTRSALFLSLCGTKAGQKEGKTPPNEQPGLQRSANV